jgi:hypothetical protein
MVKKLNHENTRRRFPTKGGAAMARQAKYGKHEILIFSFSSFRTSVIKVLLFRFFWVGERVAVRLKETFS